jgi:hypothetical protein
MKIVFCDVPPPQDLSLGTAGQEGFLLFSFKSLNRRGGAPSGAAGSSFLGVWGYQPPSSFLKSVIFMGNSEFFFPKNLLAVSGKTVRSFSLILEKNFKKNPHSRFFYKIRARGKKIKK